MQYKNLLLLFFIFLSVTKLQAQCGDRYTEKIFTSVNMTEVTYGSNTTIGGVNKTLVMDVYEPAGDTFAMRPVIVLAHGGSFIGGDRTSGDMVYLCTEFAKRGYVCASIDYRLFDVLALPDSAMMFNVVIKAIGDMKSAVRYFRKDYSTTNTFRADTSQIFIGGTSAGAIIAVNMAYLDDPSEAPAYIQTIIANNGGIEGTSGNAGYSSKAKAVINICGAVGKRSWIDVADEPIVSFHGTNDDIVPFGHGWAMVSSFPVAEVDGSSIIHQACDSLGIQNFFRVHLGAGHVPFSSAGAVGLAYMDTTEQDIENFIAPLTVCNTGSVSIGDMNNEITFHTYPNPANTMIYINVENLKSYAIQDATGRVVLEGTENNIDVSMLQDGFYSIQVEDTYHHFGAQKFLVK